MGSLAEDRLALALEAAELGMWTWDMASARTIWDTRLEELHGLPPGGFGGTFDDWVEALHPDDRAECLARVERALADPGPYILLHRTTWPDGSVHWIECRGRVIVDDAGAPTGTIGVALDVTAARAAGGSPCARARAKSTTSSTACSACSSRPHCRAVPACPSRRGTAPAAGPTVVGGDWYAVVPLPDDCLGLAIGDVAGHGLPAVADMADARFSLRALALGEPAPERVLARLNEVMALFEDADTMITALYGVLDPRRRTWSFANAGHYPPVLRRAGRHRGAHDGHRAGAAGHRDRVHAPRRAARARRDADPLHRRPDRTALRARDRGTRSTARAVRVRSGGSRSRSATSSSRRSSVARATTTTSRSWSPA